MPAPFANVSMLLLLFVIVKTVSVLVLVVSTRKYPTNFRISLALIDVEVGIAIAIGVCGSPLLVVALPFGFRRGLRFCSPNCLAWCCQKQLVTEALSDAMPLLFFAVHLPTPPSQCTMHDAQFEIEKN